jgi:hypothetical protein
MLNKEEEFMAAIHSNDIDKIKTLILKDNIKPENFSFYGLGYACEFGHLNIVNFLLHNTNINPTEFNNASLRIALDNKHIDIVKSLWKNENVNESLKLYSKDLYNEVYNICIQNKVENF